METDLQQSWSARELGKTAAINRLPRTANPYAKHSLLWLAWVEGYIHVCSHRVKERSDWLDDRERRLRRSMKRRSGVSSTPQV